MRTLAALRRERELIRALRAQATSRPQLERLARESCALALVSSREIYGSSTLECPPSYRRSSFDEPRFWCVNFDVETLGSLSSQLTILHLRVVITANEVSLFDSVGSEDRCVHSLRDRERATDLSRRRSWLKGMFIYHLEVISFSPLVSVLN